VRWHAFEWLRAADAGAVPEAQSRAAELLDRLQDKTKVKLRTLAAVYQKGPRWIRSQGVARQYLGELAVNKYIFWTNEAKTAFRLHEEAE
jgi:TPR repeat protein